MENIFKQIDNLRPGEQVQISVSNDKKVIAERSTNKNIIRFIRFEENGSWEVFHTAKF